MRMIFSYIRRGVFLSLLILSTSVFADTLTKEATFYSDSFEGGGTSNGDTFSQSDFSAAICDMPLGQYLYVSTGSVGIVVDANDRPSCARYPQVIDLSREAFRTLAPLSVGRLSSVSVTPIGWAAKTAKGFLPKNAFAHLHIALDSSIPTVLFSGESIEIRGHVTDSQRNVLIYLSHASDAIEPISFLAPVDAKGYFRSVLALPKLAGDYTIVIASGNSFNTDTFSTITLIDPTTLTYPTLPLVRSRITPVFQ